MITYTRTITDDEQKILENDLLDVVDWINKAIEGKINNCTKRAAKQYEEMAKVEKLPTVPTTEIAKAKALFARPNYKNRFFREQDAIQTDK